MDAILRIDANLHRAVKIKAAELGITMNVLTERALRKYIDDLKSEKTNVPQPNQPTLPLKIARKKNEKS